jgi:enamine deaminase RidA (YjgF/YER057c/UK114 family)
MGKGQVSGGTGSTARGGGRLAGAGRHAAQSRYEGEVKMIEPVASMRRINPPELGTPPGYSQVVEVRTGRLVFIAGQTALDKEGKLVGSSDFAAQAEQVFRNLTIALQSAGCTASNLVKLTVFLRNMENLSLYREARNRFFSTTTPPAAPAVALVEVSKLYGPDFLIEIEAIAIA